MLEAPLKIRCQRTERVAPARKKRESIKSPHDLRGDGEEIDPILPERIGLPHKFDICLVDQSGGLQGVVRPLAAHITGSNSAQLIIDQREQAIEGRPVSISPLGE
ncbi:MAG TPA: hypothetical protein VFH31_05580 [Pyrinomonadaceae bacterium]|nr:hypothetical protein [Pyrinomonadaceae bacterium]